MTSSFPTLSLAGYDIGELIYAGSSSWVYRAQRIGDRLPVVLKCLRPDYPTPQQRSRYDHEFRILKRLQLPGVIQAYDLLYQQAVPILVLEDMGGRSLKQLPPWDWDEFWPVAIALTQTIAAIHQAGIIHKDINPANVIYNDQIQVLKLIDFGIAMIDDGTGSPADWPIPSLELAGTLAYMAPEQTGRLGRTVDSRADLYSLGATFYELLTGEPLFQGDDPHELLHYQLAYQPEFPAAWPVPFSAMLTRLLAKNPEDRYQSAQGLLADLEHCAADWQREQKIADFTIAQGDVAQQFHLSAKLYGREAEQALLYDALDRVTMGLTPCEWLLISGAAGIGKSTLMAEFRPQFEQRGYCLTVQINFLAQQTPYALAAAIIGTLIKRILQEPENLLIQWYKALREILPPQSTYWCDRIPELAWLRRLETSPDDDSSHHLSFEQVFCRVLQIFAFPEHPLVLCLDDIAQADLESLTALEHLLTDPQTQSLLLLSTHRDTVFTPEHPLRPILTVVQQQCSVRQIQLSGLDLAQITQLLVDTFHCDRATLTPLAFAVLRKTSGHPFFIKEFLQTADQTGAIAYAPAHQTWQWDQGVIEAMTMTENVVDALLRKLQQHSIQSQKLLRFAACIGTEFDLKLLARLTQQNVLQVFQSLIPWVQTQFIQPIAQHDGQLLVSSYRFAHEQIRQTVYETLEIDQRAQVHRQIARLLLEQADDPEQPDALLTIVDHYNRGCIGLTSDERPLISRLNWQASQQAQVSASETAAFRYSQMAVALLHPDDWHRDTTLCIAVLSHYAELALQQGQATAAVSLIQDVLTQDLSLLSVSQLSRLLLRQWALRGKWQEAWQLGQQLLNHWGLDLASDSSLPRVNPETAQEVQALLSDLGAIAWMYDRPLWKSCLVLGAQWNQHQTSLENRFWPDAVMNSSEPLDLTTLPQHLLADWLGRNNHQDWPVLTQQLGGVIAQAGDSVKSWSLYGQWSQLVWQFYLGLPLTELAIATQTLSEQAIALEIQPIREVAQGLQVWCTRLQDPAATHDFPTISPTCFWDESLQVMINYSQHLLTGRPSEQTCPDLLRDTPLEIAANVQSAIALARQQQTGEPCPDWLKQTLAQCQTWPQDAAQPYDAWAQLLTAEVARLEARPWAALTAYDQAIAIAQTQQQWPTAGWAAEGALQFWLAQQKPELAQLYFQKAVYAYTQWGAIAKIIQLEEAYPHWVTTSPGAVMHTTTSTATATQRSAALDLNTVLKASQALAEELHLDSLLQKLLDILLTHVGAQRGLLLLEKGSQLGIWAQGDVAQGTRICPFMSLTEAIAAQELPGTVVHYTVHTRELVVIDGTAPHAYRSDDYFQTTPTPAILCAPLLHQGELTGVIYLENRLTAGSFTESRLEVLHLLSGQAAAAIAKARLYGQLETQVNQRTQALAAKNRQLQGEIQERENTERALRLSDEKFSKVFHSSPNAIALTSLDTGEHLEVNNTFCELTGYRPDEIIGQTTLAVDLWVNPRDRDRLFYLLNSQGSVRGYEFDFRTKSGEVRTALLSAEIITIHGQRCLLGISTNITQRKITEDKLRRQNQALMETLDQLQTTQQELIQAEKMAALGQLIAGVAHEINSPLGAITASTRHLINFWQRHFHALLRQWQGFTPEQQDLFFSLLDDTQHPYPLLSTREQRQLRRALMTPLAEFELQDAREIANCFVGLGITTLEPQYQDLLRNPQGETLLKLAYQLSNLHTSMITINTASERAGKVVFALKNYARFDPSDQMVKANLIDGLETVLTLYHNQIKHHVEVIRNYASGLPHLFCYPDQLNQVWTNLLHNSLQAMANKGILRITVEYDSAWIWVKITDSGPGIPSEIQERIFAPFFTTKPPGEGSGLGLDIVRRIVDKHQGQIQVESQPGQTTFTIALPLHTPDDQNDLTIST